MRVTTCLSLDEDIYKLGFISQICDDYMDKYFDVIEGKLLVEEGEEGEDGDEHVAKKPKINMEEFRSDSENPTTSINAEDKED